MTWTCPGLNDHMRVPPIPFCTVSGSKLYSVEGLGTAMGDITVTLSIVMKHTARGLHCAIT
uniref:Uncharacterized protein n=1 Tax=Anguilla anguilla TaxID=7936 RepID=A0A0E9Q2J8_ANGAN